MKLYISFELYFTLISFILVIIESIREDEYSNQTKGADDIKIKDATLCETFS